MLNSLKLIHDEPPYKCLVGDNKYVGSYIDLVRKPVVKMYVKFAYSCHSCSVTLVGCCQRREWWQHIRTETSERQKSEIWWNNSGMTHAISSGFLPPAFQRNGESTVFTGVCLSTRGRYPSPAYNTSIHWSHVLSRGYHSAWAGPMSLPRGYPHPVPDGVEVLQPGQNRVPPSQLDGGTLIGTGWGIPSGLDGGTPIGTGWRKPPIWTGWGTSPPPHSPSPDRAPERVLATRRAVCLLHSRRKNFLLTTCFHEFTWCEYYLLLSITITLQKLNCICHQATNNSKD